MSDNPSHLKLEYLKQYAVGNVFIETGTYMGDTVRIAQDYGFDEIHSIELDTVLYNEAVKKFIDDKRVSIWHGDSADLVNTIISERAIKLNRNDPITFWLDAHASGPLPGGKNGPSPLIEELQSIVNLNRTIVFDSVTGISIKEGTDFQTHTIFIDDRRLLGTAEWGGVNEAEVIDMLFKINPKYTIIHLDGHQESDIICAYIGESDK